MFMFVTIELCCLTFIVAACIQVSVDNDLKSGVPFSQGQAVFMGLFYSLTWGFNNLALIMFCTKLWLLARKIETVSDDEPDDTEQFIKAVYAGQMSLNVLFVAIYFAFGWNLTYFFDYRRRDIIYFLMTIPAAISVGLLSAAFYTLAKRGYFSEVNQIKKS